jgi:hypothetical protein
VDRSARVRFDADGSGLAREWTWLTSDAAWLVYDPKGTGKVDSALQMFGNVSFWRFWQNGYEALRSLDDNGDGQLTGVELAGLALWHDINGSGCSEPGEVRPLSAWSRPCRCVAPCPAGPRCMFIPLQHGLPPVVQGVPPPGCERQALDHGVR